MREPLLRVEQVSKTYALPSRSFFAGKTTFYAVKNISFDLYEGDTYALIGESGSGKTTIGRIITGLTNAGEGAVWYRGINLLALSRRRFRPFRQDIQFVFQDPFSSLDPKQKAGAILEEPLAIAGVDALRRRAAARAMLEQVGLGGEHYRLYPHELSGGQRQRLNLARSLIIKPKIVVCDEPVSALDVSIQAQILNMLRRMRRELGLTMLFITHDIRVAGYIADRIGVLCRGTLVEEGPSAKLLDRPKDPYTRSLLQAIPGADKGGQYS